MTSAGTLKAMRDLKISHHRLDIPSLAPQGFDAKFGLPNAKGQIICTTFSTSKWLMQECVGGYSSMMIVML